MATRWLISLRMAFAATPVVAVLKSMWLVPRTLALNESALGMRLEDMLYEYGELAVADDEQRAGIPEQVKVDWGSCGGGYKLRGGMSSCERRTGSVMTLVVRTGLQV